MSAIVFSCWDHINASRFLLLGVLTQVTSWFQVSLSLHLNCNGVEVVGGETSLGHFSQNRLSIHRLVCGGEKTGSGDKPVLLTLCIYTAVPGYCEL